MLQAFSLTTKEWVITVFLRKEINCFEKVCVIKDKERVDWIEYKRTWFELQKCCLDCKRNCGKCCVGYGESIIWIKIMFLKP